MDASDERAFTHPIADLQILNDFGHRQVSAHQSPVTFHF